MLYTEDNTVKLSTKDSIAKLSTKDSKAMVSIEDRTAKLSTEDHAIKRLSLYTEGIADYYELGTEKERLSYASKNARINSLLNIGPWTLHCHFFLYVCCSSPGFPTLVLISYCEMPTDPNNTIKTSSSFLSQHHHHAAVSFHTDVFHFLISFQY